MGKRQRTKHVPEELIEEILTNLPVKSLLKFKSVSKSWRLIICTKAFTNVHLKKSSTNDHRLMICGHDHGSRNRTLSSSSLKFLLNDLNSQDYSPIPSFQHRDLDVVTPIIGSCNGLIFLAFRFPCHYLILWNPSTRQVNNNIPPPPNGYEWNDYTFGYDDTTDDYKIVSISMFHPKSFETHMYSLKTDSWNKIDIFDTGCFPLGHARGKYLNGKLHWKAARGNTTVIVSLDLAQGKHDILARPQQLFQCFDYVYDLDVLGGCLCFVRHGDVWSMNKYGDPKSWYCRTFSDIGIPIWLTENGDVAVALRGSTITVYDRRIKSRIYTVASAIDGQYCIYVETLVSPFGR